jgi:hypothetical protein
MRILDAPLSHANEAEHRRLIALRANAVAYDQGEFQPTFTFATPGNLSVSYASRAGWYVRTGALVMFSMDLAFTPTYTTASGLALFGGLPYVVSGKTFMATAQINNAVTWPTSRTDILADLVEGTSQARIFGIGSGQTPSGFGTAQFVSGVAQGLVRIQGFYATSA